MLDGYMRNIVFLVILSWPVASAWMLPRTGGRCKHHSFKRHRGIFWRPPCALCGLGNYAAKHSHHLQQMALPSMSSQSLVPVLSSNKVKAVIADALLANGGNQQQLMAIFDALDRELLCASSLITSYNHTSQAMGSLGTVDVQPQDVSGATFGSNAFSAAMGSQQDAVDQNQMLSESPPHVPDSKVGADGLEGAVRRRKSKWAQGELATVCRYFSRGKHCRFGDYCKFEHKLLSDDNLDVLQDSDSTDSDRGVNMDPAIGLGVESIACDNLDSKVKSDGDMDIAINSSLKAQSALPAFPFSGSFPDVRGKHAEVTHVWSRAHELKAHNRQAGAEAQSTTDDDAFWEEMERYYVAPRSWSDWDAVERDWCAAEVDRVVPGWQWNVSLDGIRVAGAAEVVLDGREKDMLKNEAILRERMNPDLVGSTPQAFSLARFCDLSLDRAFMLWRLEVFYSVEKNCHLEAAGVSRVDSIVTEQIDAEFDRSFDRGTSAEPLTSAPISASTSSRSFQLGMRVRVTGLKKDVMSLNGSSGVLCGFDEKFGGV